MAEAAGYSVLIVDDDEHFRQSVSSGLRSLGCECHAVGSYAEAVDLLGRKQIDYALLDHIGPSVNMRSIVERFQVAAPQTRLIGNSGSDRRDEFACAGVPDYLQKPWRVDQFEQVVRGRIPRCVDCDLDLPLRRPAREGQGVTWVCAGCGARYFAVLDESADREERLNVRPE